MEAVIIIAVIVVPVVAYYIGKEFEYIANEKGYTSKKYFWWTFLFGAVGISMVIARLIGAAERARRPAVCR